MNIHFYVNTPFPYGMAAAKRRLCYIKGLRAEGHSVDVMVCHKFFDPGETDGLPSKGEYQGTPFNYICGKYKHSKKNKIGRGLDWKFLDSFRSFFFALKNVRRNEIVYMYFYDNLLEFLLLLVCKIKGAKAVREVCEHPSSLYTDTFFNRITFWIEYNCLFPLFNGFICISHSLKSFVEDYKNKKAQTIIIPILVDEDAVSFDSQQYKNTYDVPYIIHTGTMKEQKDSVSKILRAFASFKKNDKTKCRLVFTGPQANDKCSYIPLMKKLGIFEFVDLLGLLPLQQVASLQHYASMTIIYKSDNLQTRNCFPTKLGEMLLSGIPVITTSVGDANIYIKHNESAFVIDEDDDDSLVKYIELLLTDSDLRNQIGCNGRQVANECFNPIKQGEKLSDFFRNITVIGKQ